jgi:hypothetical protein
MSISKRFFSAFILLTTLFSLFGCDDWVEEDRQANFQQCKRACNGVFADYPQHYTMCMNSGLKPNGYYNGASCQATAEPHVFCMNAGYQLPRNAGSKQNAYSGCVVEYQEGKKDRALIRQEADKDRDLMRERSSENSIEKRHCDAYGNCTTRKF